MRQFQVFRWQGWTYSALANGALVHCTSWELVMLVLILARSGRTPQLDNGALLYGLPTPATQTSYLQIRKSSFSPSKTFRSPGLSSIDFVGTPEPRPNFAEVCPWLAGRTIYQSVRGIWLASFGPARQAPGAVHHRSLHRTNIFFFLFGLEPPGTLLREEISHIPCPATSR